MIYLSAVTVSIGDELLSGKTIDSNNAYISQQLEAIGIPVVKKLIVGDEKKAIMAALDWGFSEADIVTLTGGLGPTHDDITKMALCEYFNVGLIQYPELLERLRQRFAKRGFEFSKSNESQAEYPSNAKLLTNSRGTAQGMYFSQGKKHLYVMPGVPREMRILIREHIVPQLSALGDTFPESIDIHTIGIPESTLYEITKPILDEVGDCKVAYLPGQGMVSVRVSFFSSTPRDNTTRLNNIYFRLKEKIPENIFGRDNDTLQSVVGNLLLDEGATVATAESCTGGLIASMITDVSGSSEYFNTGLICYANNTKVDLLGVNPKTLNDFGAVSEETVSEMLSGALQNSGADYVIAVSGVAGPSGGSKEKPVGTIYIGVAGKKKRYIKRFQFGNDRVMNKTMSAHNGLNLLRLLLEGIL